MSLKKLKRTSVLSEVMQNGHGGTIITLKSSFLPEKPERRILKGYCRGVGPRSSLSMYILGLRPNLRTKGHSRKSEHCQGNSC